MNSIRFYLINRNPTFEASIVGGVLGIVLQLEHTITTGDGTSYSLGVVFIASLLAGFLAHRNEGKSRYAGIAAAALTLLPAVLSVHTPVKYFIDTYDLLGVGIATAIVVLFVTSVGLLAIITGLLGGNIGGWIENTSPI